MYGSHHSLEKQFQSMNIFLQRYDYSVTLIKREKDISSLRSPYSLKVESYSLKNALCQVWLKLAQWFWRGRFLNFVTEFSYFVIISPWKMLRPFHLHPRMLCVKIGWNWISSFREENVKSFRLMEDRWSEKLT